MLAALTHRKAAVPTSSNISIRRADLFDTSDQRSILDMLDAYARDRMGDSKPLAPEVRERLIPGLQRHPTTLVLLAHDAAQAVGIAVCFIGFSTFQARPLVNIHDLAVVPSHRGCGIGRRLLEGVEHAARELGCCKLTLEVLEHNRVAQRTYRAAGFAPAQYDPAAGCAQFWAKPLQVKCT